MLEIIVGIGVCVLMAKIASIDRQSGKVWFFITLGICVLCLLIPLPIFRMAIAGVIAFVSMIVYKMVAS